MNPEWVQVIVATAVAWLGAGAAALVRRAGVRVMQWIVYGALLVFAGIALFDILPESKSVLTWPVFAASVTVGYATFWAIGTFITPICPACAMRHLTENHDHGHRLGHGLDILIVVLALHCFVDGLGISAAGAVSSGFAVRVFIAVAIHKFPEGFALALILMPAMTTVAAAVLTAIALEATTVLGAAMTMAWKQPSPFWIALVLAHIGGTFLYLSISGLQDAWTANRPRRNVVTPIQERTV